MRPFPTLALWAALALGLLTVLDTASAQEPTPSATPNPFCETSSLEGGGTRVVYEVEITLPEGTYNVIVPPPGTGPGPVEPRLILCHNQTGGYLILNATNCEEGLREIPSPEAEAVIDAIVASCRIAPTPPEPSPQLCPEGESVTGEQTITIAESARIALPAGEFVVHVTGDLLVLCKPGSYSLSLQLSNCRQANIPPPDATDLPEQQDIVASCTLLHPVTPVPQFTPLSEPGAITPPDTGDAGLRAP